MGGAQQNYVLLCVTPTFTSMHISLFIFIKKMMKMIKRYVAICSRMICACLLPTSRLIFSQNISNKSQLPGLRKSWLLGYRLPGTFCLP